MEQRYLIDSNVIIDYTADNLPKNGNNFVENIFSNNFQISVVVKIEVLGFNDLPNKMLAMEEFISLAYILDLEESIVEQTITLRKNHKKLKLGDAIIAATALIHNLVLVTRNTSDFNYIDKLQIINPHNL